MNEKKGFNVKFGCF